MGGVQDAGRSHKSSTFADREITVGRTNSFSAIERKMKDAEIPDLAIESFRFYYRKLVSGETGMMPESSIRPVDSVPHFDDLGERTSGGGTELHKKTVMLKLNGGLGTSMGLNRAKSVLTVKEHLNFLDIIIRQTLERGCPLLFMNSFNTREDTDEILKRYPKLRGSLPLTFLQHRVPKIDRRTLEAVEFPKDPQLEWCPPGHGDLYGALLTSRALDQLLDADVRYAFISNADNLGATLHDGILEYFADRELDFLMEVAHRTSADRKGGHLAHRRDGDRFVLRESAQCPDDDRDAFQDIDRYRFFNTNNLWINLGALRRKLDQERFLRLPMIRNAKTVDPRDPESTPVYQLETAVGAAITLFENADVIEVPRSRFAPVKTCEDLLVVRSDATALTDDYRIVPASDRSEGPPVLSLDERYYKLIDDLESRFPEGPPSLVKCRSLKVTGDILFGRAVQLEGDVEIVNRSGRQVKVDQTRIEGQRVLG
jgi:UTP--glucose-1-phosphate uridylyltransferase